MCSESELKTSEALWVMFGKKEYKVCIYAWPCIMFDHDECDPSTCQTYKNIDQLKGPSVRFPAGGSHTEAGHPPPVDEVDE